MFKKIGKYAAKRLTGNLVGKVVRYGFWGLLFTAPGPMVAAVGVTGVAVSAIVVHSGLVEYGVSTLVPI